MRICGQNQPSGVKSIEIHVSLTYKYRSGVLFSDVYSYLFGLRHQKAGDNDKLLSIAMQRSAFVSFANFLVYTRISVAYRATAVYCADCFDYFINHNSSSWCKCRSSVDKNRQAIHSQIVLYY